jgi:hypothetical protein
MWIAHGSPSLRFEMRAAVNGLLHGVFAVGLAMAIILALAVPVR